MKTWWGGIFGSIALIAAVILFLMRVHVWAPTEHVVLSLEGSTSLGDELMPRLATAFLRDDMGAVETGLTLAGRDAKGHARLHVWGKVPGRSGLQVIEVYATGSAGAFECLASDSGTKSCDIGMSSRPINDADKASYPALKNLEDRGNEHVVALDAIAVIVYPQNPVRQLSVAQLRAIYKGEIRNWKDVGGGDAPIELFGRDNHSGTFEMFTEKVIGKDPGSSSEATVVPPEHQIADSRSIVNAVTNAPNAIGYVSSTMVEDAKALSISDGSGPAILPTELSIVTEDYPICRRLLLYDWDAPGSVMDAFVRYVVYKPGQTLIEETPFVELTPRIFRVSPPANAPVAYKKIASQYSRIGLSFHFSPEENNRASGNLDSLARVNILRLRTFLAQREQTGSDILLIGFADKEEGVVASKRLAQKEAEEIATSLRAIGVVVPSQNILSFGGDLPVASNDTPEGRRKNLRVEVWIPSAPNDADRPTGSN
jgi:phosphate transport system substrate-binding protein